MELQGQHGVVSGSCDKAVIKMSANSTLEIRQLDCIRGERELFRDLSFALTGGDVLQIHGANGSGKTTILRILAGLTQPDQGDILWNSDNIKQDMAGYLANIRYSGHLTGIKLELSPLENLRYAVGIQGGDTAMPIEQALDEINLFGFEHEPARTLSAGQRRRIALARLLVSPGRLWLLDEPHTSLDNAGMQILQSILHQHLDSGGMIIMASHTPIELHEKNIHSLQLLT